MNAQSPATQQQTREQQIEERIDLSYARGIEISAAGAGSVFVPKSMGEAMEFAKMMAVSGPMVGKSFRGNPGACLGIAMQAWRVGMDPFPFSQKAYVVSDTIAYEAQLVAAIIHTRAPIEGKPTYSYSGEGVKLSCTVSVKMIGDDEPKVMVSPEVSAITTKNSPLWKTDPRQQLAYYTIRNWARLYCPEIILGVYDVDEMEEAARAERARDITPKADAASALNAFAGVKAEAREPAKLFHTADQIELELRSAPDRATLRDIWQNVVQEGDLVEIRDSDPASHSRLCELYNSLAEAFENPAGGKDASDTEPTEETGKPEVDEKTRAAEPPRFTVDTENNVIDGETGEVVPENCVKRFKDGSFSVLRAYHNRAKDDAGKPEPEAASETTAEPSFIEQALDHLQTLTTVAGITRWYDNTFLEDAQARDEVTEADIARVNTAKNQRLGEIVAKAK